MRLGHGRKAKKTRIYDLKVREAAKRSEKLEMKINERKRKNMRFFSVVLRSYNRKQWKRKRVHMQ